LIVMAASMAAMMVPTAAPFFFAYGRDTRRPTAVVITLVIYVAVWAAIGAIADFAMGQVMMPSSLVVAAAAVAFAVAWTLSPWSRRAHAVCREMCMRRPRAAGLRGALLHGTAYATCCLVCSAGVMAALVVLGMSNLGLIVVAAAALLVYKVTDWGALVPGLSRSR
jgi:predicted metal-binding membrane protein